MIRRDTAEVEKSAVYLAYDGLPRRAETARNGRMAERMRFEPTIRD
jgi:hypothetical protein